MVGRALLRTFFLTLVTTIVIAGIPQAIAQQPPLPNAPSAQNSNTTATKDTKDDPAANPVDKTVGKSKLEQQTGTKNDRIFEVLPNYGTVRTSKNLPPLTDRQKFRLATAGAFDWAVWPFNGALAAIAQAKNDPESWGQGWGAYGKRYGASFADNTIGTYMTTAIFPSLLHEDPRYYRMAEGPISHRIYYSMNRLFVTRTDAGETRFNYSESIGNAAAAAISNVYYPASERTASRNATTFGFLILYDGLSNELKEFWPDIHRKLAHKKTTP
ncbi:MAG TPA: hypothetical protein VII23_08730 [Terriglobales bacterium]